MFIQDWNDLNTTPQLVLDSLQLNHKRSVRLALPTKQLLSAGTVPTDTCPVQPTVEHTVSTTNGDIAPVPSSNPGGDVTPVPSSNVGVDVTPVPPSNVGELYMFFISY